MSISMTFLNNIGWALIHSLWQSAILFTLYILLAKLPVRDTVNYRYALSTVMLMLVAVCFATTIVISNLNSQAPSAAVETEFISTSLAAIESTNATFFRSFEDVRNWVDGNLLWVIRIWFIGTMIGILRVASGVAYLYFLRKSALPITGMWEERMRSLATGLQVSRAVEFAEAHISTPIVIGILKPAILFPVGLMAGLSTSQIDAILVHELAHIRRHDFVVNLFQCLMESVLFFNPFVWLLSARIRLLREECCDDIVIRRGISPLVYVKTLAHVEELSAIRSFAPAFAGQRNQLLKRMKRIMERSVVKKEWGMVRLLPLWLALLGLVCASWLSIGSETTNSDIQNLHQNLLPHDVTAADSVVDAKGEQAEHDSHRAYSETQQSWTPPADAPADAAVPNEFHYAPIPEFEFQDSIPGFFFMEGDDWEEFEQEFTKKFRQEFGEFFNKNRGQYEKMMEDLRRQHSDNRSFLMPPMDLAQSKAWEELSKGWEDFALVNPVMPNMENFHFPELAAPNHEWFAQGEQFQQQAQLMGKLLDEHEGLFLANGDLWRLPNLMQLDNANTFQEYEEAIVDQLIEDGYLEKGEKIGDLHIRNDEITVNGKKIKEKDRKKYEEIRKKFEPRWSRPHRPE